MIKERRRAERQMKTQTEEKVGAFLESNPAWVEISECSSGGMGLCDSASDELITFLRIEHPGVEAVVLWLDGTNHASLGTNWHYPDEVGGKRYQHCVVLVEGRLVVDLTARQFDTSLPFPYYWNVPYGWVP